MDKKHRKHFKHLKCCGNFAFEKFGLFFATTTVTKKDFRV